MRVLQINITANIWSTGKIASEIGDAVIQDNGESIIAYGLESQKCNSKLIKICRSKYFWYFNYYFFSLLLDLPGWGSVFSTIRLIKKINKTKPDIIHLHHIHWSILNINILFFYLSKHRIPIIWTFHDCWAFTGGCTHFNSLKCNKWESLCSKCPRFIKNKNSGNYILCDNSKFNFLHKKKIFNSVNNLTIVTVSSWLQDMVKKSFLGSLDIEKISNGINTQIFNPNIDYNSTKKKYCHLSDFVVLGVASSWNEKKGLFDFYKLREILSPNISILLIGLSEVQINELPPGIIGISPITNQYELASFYSLSDVLVSLSQEETFGLTVVESLACGTPVIVYDNTALPELITTGIGMVAENNNIQEVKDYIIEILTKGKLSFSEMCIKYAKCHYSSDMMTSRYLDLYKKIIGNNKGVI